MILTLRDEDAEKLAFLSQMGERRRCATLEYVKQTGEYSRRLVEPYVFQRSGPHLMVDCWQLDPDTGEPASWRNFRVDRILSLADGGRDYEPRRVVDLRPEAAREFCMAFEPPGPLVAMNDYLALLDSILLDGKLTRSEVNRAGQVAARLSPAQVKAVHAQAYRDALHECLLDGAIDWREEEHLAKVRRFLKKLGWAPGDRPT